MYKNTFIYSVTYISYLFISDKNQKKKELRIYFYLKVLYI